MNYDFNEKNQKPQFHKSPLGTHWTYFTIFFLETFFDWTGGKIVEKEPGATLLFSRQIFYRATNLGFGFGFGFLQSLGLWGMTLVFVESRILHQRMINVEAVGLGRKIHFIFSAAAKQKIEDKFILRPPNSGKTQGLSVYFWKLKVIHENLRDVF